MFEILPALFANLSKAPVTRPYPYRERPPSPAARGRIESVIEKCIFCGICQKRCPADCIVVNRAEKTWSVDPYQCIICGVCVEVCPTDAIAMRTEYRKPRSERTPLNHHQEREPGEQRVEG